MDFEMAVWEMTHLIIAPKKVFRSIYYHNTYHLADPSFTYLLSSFQLLTGIAWGIATQGYAGPTLRLTLMFIFVHFLLSSIIIATLAYLLIGRLLGPGGKGLPSRMRRRGLFGEEGGGRDGEVEELEFGYCFDVAIRAFFPVWICLYVLQFVFWYLIRGDHWISLFLGNTLYLVAFSYSTVIFFLGYNALPFLQHTELLLSPIILYAILWAVCLFGFNVPKHVGPLMTLGGRS
ncbi:MAG: hypothetical protein L6R40_004817 [Gallowayella cf. fulva]|nr:MAG: hypothetical protein L6R40_004817 [Xanthomendoza cf. fulva]